MASLRGRDFSANKDVVSTNMVEDLVIAHCRVYDGIQSLDVPMEQCITPEMLQHCRFAHSKYVNHMDDNKKQSVESEKDRKRKAVWEEVNQEQKRNKAWRLLILILERKLTS